jgi:lysophospholipase L1-like esterase
LGHTYEVRNLGKTGLRVAQVLSSFGSEISVSTNPVEGILLFLGANDCFRLTHPKDFKSHLEALISELKSRYSPKWIYLADIPPVHLFPAFPPLLRTFLKSQRNFLQKEMIRLYSADNQLIFDPISLTLSPEFFSIDGVHPSDLGYEKIAEFAMEGLKKRGNT